MWREARQEAGLWGIGPPSHSEAFRREISQEAATEPRLSGTRLLCCGQTAMRSPAEGIADLKAIKALGLRGVMMPGEPAEADYDSEVYNPFWEAAIELQTRVFFCSETSIVPPTKPRDLTVHGSRGKGIS